MCRVEATLITLVFLVCVIAAVGNSPRPSPGRGDTEPAAERAPAAAPSEATPDRGRPFVRDRRKGLRHDR